MKITLQEVQDLGTEMLREVVRICEEEDIPYYLYYGTLLGAIRHKGSIPWDADVDIAVPIDAYNRFSEAMEQKLDQKYWWDFRSDKSPYRTIGRVGLSGYDTYYLHVDVFPLIGYSGKKWKDKLLSLYIRYLVRLRVVKTVNPKVYGKRKRRLVKVLKALLFPVSVKGIVKRFDRACRRYSFNNAEIVGCQEGPHDLIRKEWLEPHQMKQYSDFQTRVPQNYDAVLTNCYGDYMTPLPGANRPGLMQEIIVIDELQ